MEDGPGGVVRSINPATGEVLAEFAEVDAAQVRDALTRARVAQGDWGARPVAYRVRVLRPLLEALIDARDGLAAVISQETGKPRYEALTTEILPALDAFDALLRNAESCLRDVPLKHKRFFTTRSELWHEPYGVVGLITPWNYPLFLTFPSAMAALLGGNAVLNKPSEFTPRVGIELKSLVRKFGLPPALYQCLPGAGATGAALVDAGCDKIVFTGSVATGRKVAAACAERLTPCTLELGGKDAAIVWADANVERAAKALTWGAFTNAGQACSSVERIYAHRDVERALCQAMVDQIQELRQGPDRTFDVDLGPMTTRAQYETVVRQVEAAKQAGARVLTGGSGQPSERGGSFAPTLLTGVPSGQEVLVEETFGPVATVKAVNSVEEVIREVNGSAFGLTASVWTADAKLARRLAQALRVGSVYVNDALAPGGAGEAPWGGVKHSGWGKTRGVEGLMDMVRVKHVAWERLGRGDNPAWYPYTAQKYRVLSDMIPALFSVAPVKRVKAGVAGLRSFLGFSGG